MLSVYFLYALTLDRVKKLPKTGNKVLQVRANFLASVYLRQEIRSCKSVQIFWPACTGLFDEFALFSYIPREDRRVKFD